MSTRFNFKPSFHQNQFTVLIHQALEANQPPPKGASDWRGFKYGRMTVVAYSHATPKPRRNGKSNGVRKYWVCRCICGNFEMRRTSTLKEANPNSMCEECCIVRRTQEPKRLQVAA